MALEALGYGPDWAQAFAALGDPALAVGRVVLEHGRFYRVHDGETERLAVATGKLRHEAASAAALPTVGDWVAFRPGQGEALASIRAVLPRRSKFSRRGAGHRTEEQVVAANVDTIFLVMALDGDYNLRRLERYLAVGMASGARPVVVLGKADLCPDVDARLAEVQALARSLPVVTMALVSPDGHAGLLPFLRERETVALLGSSGVGKSTLLNRLAGTDLQRTKEVRAHDSRGRHTTTHAQLFALPGGALCIDTPGMRELQLWEEAGTGLGSAFEDVEAIAARCRFRDCRHGGEPGCAVREALEAGTLPQDRYDSFAKLSAEIAATRDDLGARQRRKQGERVVARARRKLKDDE